jgi:RNA polymerase sigma-70 factor (ECF subfamily)
MNAELFEALRPALLRHAYRMLGSRADAEDVVQDAYVRRLDARGEEVRDERAYARTIVTRLCLDRLGSAQKRHETYVGPWLPEPFVEDDAALPERATEIAEDISFAFMLALDRLTPAERAAFLLHDVLGVPFEEIAATLQRTEPAVRRLASRGREHVRESHRAGATRRDEADRVRLAFLDAIRRDDVDALKALFARDAVFVSDGGGKAAAALNPLYGADRIAAFYSGVSRKLKGAIEARNTTVNGVPGMVISALGVLVNTLALEIEDGKIVAVYAMRNPDKLRGAAARFGLMTEDRLPAGTQPPTTPLVRSRN